MLLYHLFINVIYFSISSFLNSNIHKILTVCKKTWVMAHQRTVTKNRYIFFIVNQGKKIHILYAYTGDQSTKDDSQEGIGAKSEKLDMKVQQGGASALLTKLEMNFERLAFLRTTPVNFHFEPCVPLLRLFKTAPPSKSSIYMIYTTIRQTNNQSIRQTSNPSCVSLIEAQPWMEW